MEPLEQEQQLIRRAQRGDVAAYDALVRAYETPAFRALVRTAFGQRRKTLRNAWRGLFDWTDAELAAAAAQAGIALEARGETLAVEDFARLAALAPSPSPRDGNS